MPDSYYKLRSNYNPNDARSNGYRSHGYFEKEQAILLKEIDISEGTILDIACGTGLMLLPLLKKNIDILGVDYDLEACNAAKSNSVSVINGDAFKLPITNKSVDYVICCQFLNQQEKSSVFYLLEDIYRVLNNGKKATIIWRNGDALVHRIATLIYKIIALIFNGQTFPYFNHTIKEVEKNAEDIGFKIYNKAVIFPPLSWKSTNTTGFASKIIGASYMITIEKPL